MELKQFCLILPLALVLCFVFGCADSEKMSDLEEFKAQADIEEQNKALVRRYIESLNSRKYETLRELLSPEYAVYSPSGYPDPANREKLIENHQGTLEVFSEFSWSIKDIFAAEDKVTIRLLAQGIYKGGIPDLPKDETKFEFSMITIIRIEDGKIIEEWQEDDQLGLARQLGMELKPKDTKK